MQQIIPIETIQSKIILIRGEKVLLDRDLAELYGVETFNLNKAVKRNMNRFPDDFMFTLNKKEWEALKFHSGISSAHGGRRTLPYAFTEQGVAMLSSVLRSPPSGSSEYCDHESLCPDEKIVGKPRRTESQNRINGEKIRPELSGCVYSN